jgi:hypothetical protein
MATMALLSLLLSAQAVAPHAPCAALSQYAVTVAADATPAERFAAAELVAMLQKVACPPPVAGLPAVGVRTCRGPQLEDAAAARGKAQLAVGHGAAMLAGLQGSALEALAGNESYLLRSIVRKSGAPSVAISGHEGATRGTFYATTRLLEELGVVFLATDETTLPTACPATSWSAALNISHTPTFEYRDCDASPNRNLTFDLRQHYNGQSALAGALQANDTVHGGYVQYAGGFVHTSYSILGGAPPAGKKLVF